MTAECWPTLSETCRQIARKLWKISLIRVNPKEYQYRKKRHGPEYRGMMQLSVELMLILRIGNGLFQFQIVMECLKQGFFHSWAFRVIWALVQQGDMNPKFTSSQFTVLTEQTHFNNNIEQRSRKYLSLVDRRNLKCKWCTNQCIGFFSSLLSIDDNYAFAINLVKQLCQSMTVSIKEADWTWPYGALELATSSCVSLKGTWDSRQFHRWEKRLHNYIGMYHVPNII